MSFGTLPVCLSAQWLWNLCRLWHWGLLLSFAASRFQVDQRSFWVHLPLPASFVSPEIFHANFSSVWWSRLIFPEVVRPTPSKILLGSYTVGSICTFPRNHQPFSFESLALYWPDLSWIYFKQCFFVFVLLRLFFLLQFFELLAEFVDFFLELLGWRMGTF